MWKVEATTNIHLRPDLITYTTALTISPRISLQWSSSLQLGADLVDLDAIHVMQRQRGLLASSLDEYACLVVRPHFKIELALDGTNRLASSERRRERDRTLALAFEITEARQWCCAKPVLVKLLCRASAAVGEALVPSTSDIVATLELLFK